VSAPERARDDRGQTSLLIVGLCVTLMMAVAVVVDASAAYLQRQGLDNLADGAALHAADAAASGEEVYTGGLGERLDLVAETARSGVGEYLASTGAYADFPGLRHSVSVDPAGQRVVVSLRAPLDLPLAVRGSPGTATVSATGSAVVTVLDLGP
jgi:hypothetical protein